MEQEVKGCFIRAPLILKTQNMMELPQQISVPDSRALGALRSEKWRFVGYCITGPSPIQFTVTQSCSLRFISTKRFEESFFPRLLYTYLQLFECVIWQWSFFFWNRCQSHFKKGFFCSLLKMKRLPLKNVNTWVAQLYNVQKITELYITTKY